MVVSLLSPAKLADTCAVYRFSFFICVLLCMAGFQKSYSQNLFPNPGFEDINNCTEYHADCAPEGWFYLMPTSNPLVKERVVPKPLLGHNLLLLPIYDITKSNKPLVYSMLTCPLIKGEKYKLSFYLHTSGRPFFYVDVCFTNEEPAAEGFAPHAQKPAFKITPAEMVADMKRGWKAVEFFFTASGEEQYCLLGNLGAVQMPYRPEDGMNKLGMIYYFIDEIKLQPLEQQPACADYEENLRKIYMQNSRHTVNAVVQKKIPRHPKPLFVKDTITIPAAFFETGKADLKKIFTKQMDSICISLAQKNIAKIDITGHTDNKGNPVANLKLSISRAEAVKNYLLSKLPQFAEVIFAGGRGQELPVADNNTTAGRAKNRRVEIVLTLLGLQQ